ncbi:MAG TPA: hypothetical protein VGP76_00065 [Planctomycetaceae bacterium]|jgi:hypothetical protein|nr:hypothetical protein [Planctomycetaceae bacterium]
MSISRAASILVAASYLCLAALGKLPNSLVASIAPALIFGLPLIWFPEQIGGLTGFVGRATVHSDTPPFLVAFMGWVFLLGFPVFFAALSK